MHYRPLAALALILTIPAGASTITRYFGGTITSQTGTGGDIPIGTLFTGVLIYDDATPHCGCADSQHRDYNLTPPGFIQVVLGSGLYDIQVTNVGLEVENNYTAGGTHDGAFFWSNGAMTVTGSGTETVFSDPSSPILQWNKSGTSPITNADSLATLAAELELSGWAGGFAGVHITLSSAGTVLHGSFTSFSDTAPSPEVPEPATAGLAGLALAGLAVCRYRRRGLPRA